MGNIKTFIKKYSEFFIILLLICLLYAQQLFLLNLNIQKISFLSFVLDFGLYFIIFFAIYFIPNAKTKKGLLLFFFSLLSLILIADTLFVAYYGNYASFTAVTEIGLVADGETADMGLRILTQTIFQAALFSIGIAIILTFKFNQDTTLIKKTKFKAIIFLCITSCLTLFNYSFFYQIKTKTYATNQEYYNSNTFLLNTLYSTNKFVEKYGYYNFRIREVVIYINNLVSNLDSCEQVFSYFAKKEEKSANNQTGAFKDYNVINLLCETLDTKLISYIDEKLKNDANTANDDLVEKLIPTYYEIIKGTAGENYGLNNSGSLIFENYYVPAFNEGCTINSEFMSLTSIYPFTLNYWSANIGNKYGHMANNYYSLPAQLNKYYDSYYMHGNSGSFYDRENLIQNIGFENIYFNNNSTIKHDENLMNWINNINTENLFYADLLTYSMHLGNYESYPDINNRALNLYNELQPSWNAQIVTSETNAMILSYFEKAIYFDNFLNGLLEWIENENVGKTIINIYPDHYFYGLCSSDTTGQLYKEYFGVAQSENEVNHMMLTTFITDEFSNYIDYGGNSQVVYSDLMSTIDLTPTILNWLDNSDESKFQYRYLFGNDYFDNPSNNYVYFQDLSVLTYGVEYNIDGTCKTLSGTPPTNSQIDIAKKKLYDILEELDYCKIIITENYYLWLKKYVE